METADQHSNDSKPSQSRPRRLSEAEVKAGGYKAIKALVPDENFSGEDHSEKEESRRRTAEARKRLKEQGLGQFNVTTTLDKDRRKTLRAAAEAIAGDKFNGALAAVIEDTVLQEIALALSGDAKMRAICELMLADENFMRVIGGLLANCEALSDHQMSDWLERVEIMARVIHDPDLWACVAGLVADSSLKGLWTAIQGQPALRRAAEAARANERIAEIAARLATSGLEIVGVVATALAEPHLISLGRRATATSAIRNAVEAAIADPRTSEIGRRFVSLRGPRASLVKKLLDI